MQLTTQLVETLKSGKIIVSQNNIKAVEVEVKDKKIDVNATDKGFIKEIISSARSGIGKGGVRQSLQRTVDGIRTARKSQPLLKEIVEDLCREGVTVTFSYKGDRVVTVGRDADSKFTRLLTGTKGVQIDSPRKLLEMGL